MTTENGSGNGNNSNGIGNLATALAAAQGQIKSAEKNASIPNRGRYADLASTWDACREALSNHGLSVVQIPLNGENDTVGVTTVLMHKSGESISGTLFLPVGQRTPQAVGSAITYARRYMLAAMVGVAPEDDDGQDAAKGAGSHVENRPAAEATRQESPTEEWPTAQGGMSDTQWRNYWYRRLLRMEGWLPAEKDFPAQQAFISSLLGKPVQNLKSLSGDEFRAAAEELIARNRERRRFYAVAGSAESSEADRDRLSRLLGKEITTRRFISSEEWRMAADAAKAEHLPDPEDMEEP